MMDKFNPLGPNKRDDSGWREPVGEPFEAVNSRMLAIIEQLTEAVDQLMKRVSALEDEGKKNDR